MNFKLLSDVKINNVFHQQVWTDKWNKDINIIKREIKTTDNEVGKHWRTIRRVLHSIVKIKFKLQTNTYGNEMHRRRNQLETMKRNEMKRNEMKKVEHNSFTSPFVGSHAIEDVLGVRSYAGSLSDRGGRARRSVGTFDEVMFAMRRIIAMQ